MKAKLEVRQGRDLLFTAIVTRNDKGYEDRMDAGETFREDLYNIERYINTQGAYRCHVSEVDLEAR